jgi:phospholipase/carboxylesterase
VSALDFQERPAAGQPDGLLILHHGRGADEHDLLPAAEALDPEHRLHVVTPGGPLRLPGWPGRHWYAVPRVGYPDPDTFHPAFGKLADFQDELWERTGIGPDRTVLSGFSMGSVMSYALGLAGTRPRPAGLLIHAGFIPTVAGWTPDLASRAGLPVRISHGVRDPVMSVEFGRQAAALLEAGGLAVDYEEHPGGHEFGPHDIPAGRAFLAATLPPAAS